MSRWFRFYDAALDDPKVQRLDGETFKAWVNLLCLSSRNGGFLPPIADIAFSLRIDDHAARTLVERLLSAALLDRVSGGSDGYRYAPHAWQERQYKSDTSTDRVKRFRERCSNVTETPPDTEADTDTEKKKLTPPKGGQPYVFEGQVIRLQRREYQAWEKAYPNIDLRASLQSRDDWLATEADEKTKKRWFMSTSNHLANLQSKASAVDRAPVWDGMP
jgi:hypothetical protein